MRSSSRPVAALCASRLALGALLAASCSGAPATPGAPAPATPGAPAPTTPGAPAPTISAPPTAPAAPALAAPIARQVPYLVASPHPDRRARSDPYYWLRDDTRANPEVLAHLAAENRHAEAWFAAGAPLEDALVAEMRARVEEDDSSTPYFHRGYWYSLRYEQGKQRPRYVRRKGTMDAPEQIFLDLEERAAGHAYFFIGSYDLSPDGNLVAWGEDTVGRNNFTMHIKDLRTGQLLPDTAENVNCNFVWADDTTLIYTSHDPVTLRSDRVLRHVLGGATAQIFHEPDARYSLYALRTKSRRYIRIVLGSGTSDEVLLLDPTRPKAAPAVFLPRRPGHLYSIDHVAGRFVMLTNDGAPNFRLVEIAAGARRDREAWKELIGPSPDKLLQSFAAYDTFVAVSVRTGGLSKIEVVPRGREGGTAAFLLDAPDPTYAMGLVDLPDPASRSVRYSYNSLTSPHQSLLADVQTRAVTLLKQQPVPTYDASLYTSEYLHATAADGARIPISLVARKSTPRDGTAPLLIHGYGAYGVSTEPTFRDAELSLLDRGWVYAIAHVRGGQELGRAWYEDGKLGKKMNTFTDFIAATELLVGQRYAARGRVYAMGHSAGGLLMGAIANLRPDLYRGIVALAPFVDVVTTMLDETIPLTTGELTEWGDPKERAAYDTMLTYSPYDNVKAAPYPAMYVRTGLHDSQVQYYEPTKWVARLRARKTDANPLLLETDLHAGHGGGTAGRFDQLRETARALTFLLLVDARPDARTLREQRR
jgi:oligopeptidase B